VFLRSWCLSAMTVAVSSFPMFLQRLSASIPQEQRTTSCNIVTLPLFTGSNSSAPSLWTDSTSSASSADWASSQQQTANFLDRCACAPCLPGDFVLRLQDTAHLEIRLITLRASRRAPYSTGQAAIFMSPSFIFALRTASV
jgi:hypothetical protein